ncbi:MAG: hypothetical protein AAF821_25050 [Cyanobacteria bacterium P01_D01_bin.156]
MYSQDKSQKLWTNLSKKQQEIVKGGQLFPIGNGGGWWRPGAGRGENPVPNAMNTYSNAC